MRRSARRSSVRLCLAVTAALAAAVAAFGCGSRTGLFGGFDGDASVMNADVSVVFPGQDDVQVPDERPGVDAALPPIDGQVRDAANRNDCPDAQSTLVYVVTSEQELFSFYPPDGSFRFISRLACPAAEGASPFSMAVDRRGVAYVLYTDDQLYRVSTANGACARTTYRTPQQNFRAFGMGYAASDVGEVLFVAGTADGTLPSPGLGSIDTSTFVLSRVGPFVPSIERAELTGTGDGRLFAFYTKGGNGRPPAYIGEVDTRTAKVVAETPLPTVDQGTGWAFAFWGGDFYLFTASGDVGSQVTRYRPQDGSLDVSANLPTKIVGAGVSTCAPSQ